MKQSVRHGLWWGGLLSLAVAMAWAQTTTPPSAAKSKLERLKIAVAPLGWDTNFTWLQTRSGMLDKRPALEYLVGIDRYTGAYIPELAEKWVMSPDGKDWTVTLRQGIPFHENWGEFTARDVRHAVFLIAQPEAAASDTSIWRSVMGVGKADSVEEVARKVAQGVEIRNNYEFVERKVGSHVLYKRLEKHWRHIPAYKELEFRWVPEGVTRLATLMADEVHISDIDRALQREAVSKGMKIIESRLPAMQHQWHFGGTYFATPEKLDPKISFVKPEVRQAMNKAVNRQAIADTLLGGKVQPHRVMGFHPQLDSAIWPGIWNPLWDQRFEVTHGYDPAQARALLAQAGYPQGFEFTLYLYTLPGLAEIIDIGQAIALDFQAIGLKPKLVELEFPRVRELY